MLKKFLFLDRDGVINVDKNYLFKIEDFNRRETTPESRPILIFLSEDSEIQIEFDYYHMSHLDDALTCI
tara:strand:- start:148 stop:354 length:207 start_codon:yes stop_codon:yes gene_type:complete